MKEGTANELPNMVKLDKYDFVLDMFEVGLLQSNEHAYIGVSPDGIVMIKVPGGEYGNLPPVTACLEIKTRVRPNTIADAEAVLLATYNKHIIVCEYEDAIILRET